MCYYRKVKRKIHIELLNSSCLWGGVLFFITFIIFWQNHTTGRILVP